MNASESIDRLPSVGVIGCGSWGKNLVRNFHDLGALRAVSDVSTATLEHMSSTYDVPALTIDEMLRNRAIDAVAIATPAVNHAEICHRALDAGKHVFVEKPLALHTAEAEALCEKSEKASQTLMVGHLLQYHPAFIRLKSLAAEGTIGRVQYIYSNRLNLGTIRREEDILWSFAPHDISMILSLVRAEPDSVWAAGGRFLHKSIADVTTTHLSFPGGEQAHVFVSWLHPYKEQKLVVIGDSGMLVFDDSEAWQSKLTLYQHRIEWRDGIPRPVKAAAEPIALEPAEPLQIELRHFLDCAATGQRPRTDGREGTRVLRVLEAASRSMVVSKGVDDSVQAKRMDDSRSPPLLHPSSYVDEGCEIGEGTRIWHFSHILRGSRIGRDCSLGQNVVVGPNVTIGDRCKLQNNVSVYEGVTLEHGVFCGPSCVFTNVTNPRAEIDRADEFRPTLVRQGATLGANSTIVCGHTIGRYAFVAAGAVVTTDVPDHALMAGVPARRIAWVSRSGDRLDESLVCPRSGERYVLTDHDTLQAFSDA